MKAFFLLFVAALLWLAIYWAHQSRVPSYRSSFQSEAEAYILRWEGCREQVYLDSLGNPTIGVGFNLNAHPDVARAAQHGSLTHAQIEKYFSHFVLEATKKAQTVFPSFSSQPRAVQLILVDLTYQLGDKVKEFKKFRAAIERKDYVVAAQELANSKWAKQSRGRAVDHIEVLQHIH